MKDTKITLLNAMASTDFITSLDKQLKWGIQVLDLKDQIYGKALIELSNKEAEEAASHIQARGMEVYCFSTTLFFEDIEKGEEEFRKNHLSQVKRILELADILRPKVIRLLAAKSSRREDFINILPYIKDSQPWLITLYQEVIDQIAEAGFIATIENEANGCILSRPEEIIGFFEALNCDEKVFFTYDIQNLWQMGTYPSEEVGSMLAHLTGYFHLKGSQSLVKGGHTHFASSLEDATWPVIKMTKMLIDQGRDITICLNPLKGEKKTGYDYENMVERDLTYLMNNIKEIG